MNPRQLRKAIEALGWYFVRNKGDHKLFHHPTIPGIVSMPWGRPLNPGLVCWVLNQAKKGPKGLR
jgi:predicted RNA binding protein YcfA (HicA-like mRNA interferase family)